MCVGGAADAGEKDFRSGRLDRPHTLGDSEFCEGGGVEPDHLGLIDGEKVAAAGPVVDDERVDGTDLGQRLPTWTLEAGACRSDLMRACLCTVYWVETGLGGSRCADRTKSKIARNSRSD